MGAMKDVLIADWPDEGSEKQASAVTALAELVDGPQPCQPYQIDDEPAWVHAAFYTYRTAMDDNDPRLPRLARIEYDFIAALGAPNFDAQMRGLHKALAAMRAFHRE